jgi:glutaredoxin
MSRVVYVHWNVEEAAERVERLRGAGLAAEVFASRDGADLRALTEASADAYVIDLGRLPSHGRDLAIWLRQRKPSREVPVVFVGGKPAKVEGIREVLPDAAFADWDGVAETVREAVAAPPAKPVVPGVFAGYSGTPLPRKLGIKTGTTLMLLGAPEDFEDTLGTLPEEVRIKRQARGEADVVMLFARSASELKKRFPVAAGAVAEKGSLWMCWPKKASGVESDLSESLVRGHGLDNGFVDYKIAAIDATWSGLRFARRR